MIEHLLTKSQRRTILVAIVLKVDTRGAKWIAEPEAFSLIYCERPPGALNVPRPAAPVSTGCGS